MLDGLTRPFKELPPKHFYDARGSELFDAICELPEYYPTRTERSILDATAPRRSSPRTGAGELVELGSGSARQDARAARRDAPRPGTLERYVPVDVSETALRDERGAARRASTRACASTAWSATSSATSAACPTPEAGRLMCFLGGTIGNFPPGSRAPLPARRSAEQLGDDGHLLLGVGPRQGPARDRGRLRRRGRRHRRVQPQRPARHQPRAGRRLRPRRVRPRRVLRPAARVDRDAPARARAPDACTSPALDLRSQFAAREELRTEISAKFTRERLEGDLAAAGLELDGWLTDAESRFAVALASVAA